VRKLWLGHHRNVNAASLAYQIGPPARAATISRASVRVTRADVLNAVRPLRDLDGARRAEVEQYRLGLLTMYFMRHGRYASRGALSQFDVSVFPDREWSVPGLLPAVCRHDRCGRTHDRRPRRILAPWCAGGAGSSSDVHPRGLMSRVHVP